MMSDVEYMKHTQLHFAAKLYLSSLFICICICIFVHALLQPPQVDSTIVSTSQESHLKRSPCYSRAVEVHLLCPVSRTDIL